MRAIPNDESAPAARYPQAMLTPTSSHWGNYRIETRDGRIVEVHSYPNDLDPTPLKENLRASQDPRVRVAQPSVRAGYLAEPEAHSGARRGQDEFVAVSWNQALDLAATALDRTRRRHGNQAIYGGSYGWSSAGRFHHAQSPQTGQLRLDRNLIVISVLTGGAENAA